MASIAAMSRLAIRQKVHEFQRIRKPDLRTIELVHARSIHTEAVVSRPIPPEGIVVLECVAEWIDIGSVAALPAGAWPRERVDALAVCFIRLHRRQSGNL